jgi:LysM repeat protein
LIVIDPSMTTTFVAPTDPPQNALMPIPGEMRKVRDRLLGADAPAETPLATTAPMPYVVQPGDTLFSLAQRFGTSVEAITAANGLADDSIRAGQELIIPASAASSSP